MHSRHQIIQAIRSAIRDHNVSPEEIGYPQAHHFFALVSSMETYAISLSHTKLCILFYLHSYDPVTRSELRLFIPKDDSRISRSIAELTAQGYITTKDKHLSLTSAGVDLINDFISFYFNKVDSLHRYAETIHSCANATSPTTDNQL